MWTTSDTGTLINLAAVRSIGVELSDDRQFVEVQVRWANDGERAPIVTLIVQDFESAKAAMEVGWRYVAAIKEKFVAAGAMLPAPSITPPAPGE
jgi:hypothetical protein